MVDMTDLLDDTAVADESPGKCAGFAFLRTKIAARSARAMDWPMVPLSVMEQWKSEFKSLQFEELVDSPLPLPPVWVVAPPLPGEFPDFTFPAFAMPAVEDADIALMPSDPRLVSRSWRSWHPFREQSLAPFGVDLQELRILAAARKAELAKRPPALEVDTEPTTVARNLDRGRILMDRYRRECGVLAMPHHAASIAEFSNWVLSFKCQVAPGTFREYRAAALEVANAWPDFERHYAVAQLEADAGYDADENRSNPLGAGGEIRRERRIEKADFDEILSELADLAQRLQTVPNWLSDIMTAGIHTGVAPMTWPTTSIEIRSDPVRKTRRAWLHNVNPRGAESASPFARSLDISNFSPAAYDSVKRVVDRAHNWTHDQKYNTRLSQCSQLLSKVCGRLFPKKRIRYSLYAIGHQYAANMRAAYGEAKAAALIGETRNEKPDHYVNIRAAWREDEITEIAAPQAGQVQLMARRLVYQRTRERAKTLLANRRELGG